MYARSRVPSVNPLRMSGPLVKLSRAASTPCSAKSLRSSAIRTGAFAIAYTHPIRTGPASCAAAGTAVAIASAANDATATRPKTPSRTDLLPAFSQAAPAAPTRARPFIASGRSFFAAMRLIPRTPC